MSDDAAGLSYAIPEGWKQSRGKLIDAFTSSIGTERAGDGEGGTVLAGRSGAVPEEQLKRWAEAAARSNAEFFFPDGSSTLRESRETTVSGRAAHTVLRDVKDGKGRTARIRMTLVAVDDTRSAFLLGVSQRTAPETRGRRTSTRCWRAPL
ncbi:hypothetical protein ACFQ2B_01710 [Streptomyces stramineus]